MHIKKNSSIVGLFFFLIFLSACSNGDSASTGSGLSKGLIVNNISSATSKTSNQSDASSVSTNVNSNNNLSNNINNNMQSATKVPKIDQELIKKYPFALIKTDMGDIKVEFSGANAPLAVTNFLQLANGGFYTGIKFHRVIKGFMIQAGDPLSKDETMKDRWGTGGPGYEFKDELAGTEKYKQGVLAMANAGPNTNGSQFFIVTASPEAQLPPSYTIFGQVVSGMDVALKIESVATTSSDRPVNDINIKGVELLEK
jgi:peptidylprolyl isomerase